MFKKILIILIILLTLPAIASAWYVNAKTSPVTGQGTISPTGNQTYATGSDSGEYTVTAASGYRLSRVTLDGVTIAANGNGKYVAPYVASKTWRYLVAYFSPDTVSITTNVTGSGAIREDTNESLSNIPVGSNRQLLVLPNPGYAITSLTAPNATSITGDVSGKTVVFNNLQANQSVSATFSLVPVVTVDAGNDVTVNGTSAEFAATLYGSASSNQGTITYAWTGTGLIFGNSAAATTTVYAATPGTYNATLTITTGAVVKSDAVVVTVISRAAYLENLCSSCHAGTHPATVTAYDQSKHKTLLTVVVTCQTCHDPNNGGHYSIARPLNSCAACHVGQYIPKGHTAISTPCTTCHDSHSGKATGCTACHDCPPQTASHQKHFSGSEAQAGYGNTKIAKDFNGNATAYIFSCGNCHPQDSAKHRNGIVEVELSSPLAPAGSLKALNTASATYVAGNEIFTDSKGINYTKGTCSNVYCHSYNDWTTTQAIPENDPAWVSKTVFTRKFNNVTWGDAALTCSGCHGNAPRTFYPGNDGGAGDSHSWIDSHGHETLHMGNHGFDPIGCSYCHNDTVSLDSSFIYNASLWSIMGDVPINNFSRHVNGANDVAFDRINPFLYPTRITPTHIFSLANATYDSGTKTCSNVACHLKETTVKWGTPYRHQYSPGECDKCHRYSGGHPF
ncbi:MAG TPA: hypothetical protein VGJ93_00965 [Desulfuromonadaceae bacterium]|jgi:predicted CxxxxCH...CXXCH cytochrome family protein